MFCKTVVAVLGMCDSFECVHLAGHGSKGRNIKSGTAPLAVVWPVAAEVC